MTTTVLNTKIREVENKITTTEFNMLTAENFAARLKQANLIKKTDFDNKLINLKTKQKIKMFKKKLNSLITKDYNFFLGRIYFTSNDGSQNTFFINKHLIR